MLKIINMIGNTVLRTCRAILAILLIELARVTNLKPRIEAKSTSNANYQGSKPELDSKVLVEPSTEQTLRRQGSNTNTNHLESLNLNGNPYRPGI